MKRIYLPNIWMLGLDAVAIAVLLMNVVGGDIELINCATTFADIRCPLDLSCMYKCQYPCHKTAYYVSGTANYSQNSQICPSAVHDLRISTWNESARAVSLRRGGRVDYFVSTTRYGIMSRAESGSVFSYYFDSPRVTEEILDITSVHRNYLYSGSSPHVQECYAGTNAENRDIKFRLQWGSQSRQGMQSVQLDNIYRVNWTDQLGVYKANGFICYVEKNMQSAVTSLAMKGDGELLPKSFTLTASIEDKVTLSMLILRDVNKYQWKKDGQGISIPKIINERMFSNVTLSDIGFYSLQDRYTRKDCSQCAISRLIVRACPDGRYGPSCEHLCLECKNGGICHDILGTCICPPGFQGPNCESVCPRRFGRECSFACPGNGEEACKGLLFCLPDPYGCSCASGYKGPFCNIPCNRGEYGADCKQKKSCYCDDENQSCNIYTGLCPGKCQDGWHALDCTISYPVLGDPPELIEATADSLLVQFEEWGAEKDWGNGTPTTYELQYKENEERTFSSKYLKARNVQDEKYQYKLKNLKSDTDYLVRVVVETYDGTQSNNLSEVTFSTLCAKPPKPPTITNYNTTSNSVEISWKVPSLPTWSCRKVEIVLKKNGSAETITHKVMSGNTYSFRSRSFTSWSLEICFGGKGALTCSSETSLRTDEGVPNEVNALSWSRPRLNETLIFWNAPTEPNGEIRGYEILYQQTGWVHWCDLSTLHSGTVFTDKTEIDLSDKLRPSSYYFVRVRAKTSNEGPWTIIYVNTTESIPDSTPETVMVSEVRSVQFRVEWQQPNCSGSNGQITSYFIDVMSLDPWSNEPFLESTSDFYINVNYRIPFTNYEVKVFAGTEAGYSKKYAAVDVTTKPERPPSPTDLTVFHTVSDTLGISWKPPYPPYGQLDEYRITCIKEGGSSCLPRRDIPVSEVKCMDDIRSSYHCYNITNLEANKSYMIQIKAKNKGIREWGEESDSIRGITAQSAPGEPHSAYVISEKNSLTVNWSTPFISNGILTEYKINLTVTHSFRGASGSWSDTIKDVTNRNYKFSNLTPATTYKLSIAASTKAGYGPPLTRIVQTKNSAPNIKSQPKVTSVTTNMAIMSLPSVDDQGGAPISECYVVVEKGSGCNPLEDFDQLISIKEYKNGSEENNEYIAARLTPEICQVLKKFVVGNGETFGGYYNAPLKSGTVYSFQLVVISNFSGEITSSYKCTQGQVTTLQAGYTEIGFGSGLGAGIGIMVVLIILLSAVLYIVYRKPHLYKTFQQKNMLHVTKASLHDEVTFSASTNTLDIIETESIAEVPSEYIKVPDLEGHVTSMIRSGGFRQEFMYLPRGQNAPWEVAKRPENKAKNRYGNLLAYDHTRVILEQLPNDPSSDYINANYVDGYKKHMKYIATQGPKPATINDFWRMIWQEEVCKIVMATNIVENEKVKCEKYWPDGTENYDQVTVSNINTEVYTDYSIRTLQITKAGKNRIVKHFHFTTWPDHGVPMYATPVISFIKLIRSYQPSNTAPFVIHCSAGVGRTGTLILLDSMLDMANADGHVDLPHHLHGMRQQRISIVENLDQYIFVYQALVEALCEEETGIKCNELNRTMNKMKIVDPSTGMTMFEQQLQILNKRTQQLGYVDCRTAHETINQEKNRTKEIVPPDRARPMLIPTQQGYDYINAVFVDGYRQKNAFLVTQLPLPNTVADFWQLICQTESKTIVLLHSVDIDDETCPQYWPEGAATLAGNVFIQHLSTEIDRDIIVRTFTIRDHQCENIESSIIVKQFHLHSWHPSEPVPPTAHIMLDLMVKVEKWQQQCGRHLITVQCYNGACASGLYCASVIICDTIKSEQEVDVFLTVRRIRNNRPQFIKNLNQYTFLYDIALAYLDSFQAYANFQ